MAESIRKTIVINATSPEILTRKSFGKACMIIDAAPASEDVRLVKYGSLTAVADGEGSNSQAELFAKTYFANGAYGSTPPYMWVYKVDIAGGEDLAEKVGELLTKTDDFYYITTGS